MSARTDRSRPDVQAAPDEAKGQKPVSQERSRRLVKPPADSPEDLIDLYQSEVDMCW